MNMAVNLSGKVFSFTGEKALFSAPCHVLVGVSGGADSMALLHMLTHWPETGLYVTAVHVHHGLRGESADRDEQFVYRYCVDNNIALHVFREDVSAYAYKEGLSIEEAGRRVRYADFEKCRQEIGADYILTAHTSADQVETLLMRMIRGTGVDGLSGIPVARERIRRPLLCCSREEVEQYCTENHIDFVEDETNSDVGFTRNRIRHELIPLLRQINPAVEQALLRLGNHAAEDSAFLAELAEKVMAKGKSLSLVDLRDLPHPVRCRVISRLFLSAGVCSYDQSHLLAVESIIAKGYGKVRLPGGKTAIVSADGLCFLDTVADNSQKFDPFLVNELPISFSDGENVHTISLREKPFSDNVHSLFSTFVVDYDKLQGDLHVRNRREGDSIHPVGRGVGKSLKKLMNEYKIDTHKRDSLPLLCDDLGVVLIPGYTYDERIRVTDDTKHFLVWNVCVEQG